MASLPIHWIMARVYCQATEEAERVVQALDTAIPGATETREKLEGEFGNPVLVITRRVDRSEGIRSVWDRWQAANVVQGLREGLESRIDEDGVLHFRIDKQAACAGGLTPARGADAIDIQVKLKAYPAKREEILKVARGLVAEGG